MALLALLHPIQMFSRRTFGRPPHSLFVVCLAALIGLASSALVAQSRGFDLARFERYLEALRVQAGIPGLSAAIVADGEVVWERGLGFQDLENSIRATPDTPYHIVDLTQIFASALVLQCVDHGIVGLDDPLMDYTDAVTDPGVSVRHVLAHSTATTAGVRFRYDPQRYALLASVVESCSGGSYRYTLVHRVLERAAMESSVPGHDLINVGTLPDFDSATLDRYQRVLQKLAKPYRVDRRGRATASDFPPREISASAGLISTVRDLAQFDIEMSKYLLVQRETLSLAWTNLRSPEGTVLPSGLGWFVQDYRGERVVWHYGMWPDAYSSLVLKLPRRNLTLILLANSDGLSSSFGLENGDVTNSLFARLFLELFV